MSDLIAKGQVVRDDHDCSSLLGKFPDQVLDLTRLFVFERCCGLVEQEHSM
ncbi:hypothetical protein [Streptomyces sp.]|uniref:hypothetical protein n=1 Tax=Streptomyces sp. TaxID=1931 RepID=UPI002F95C6FB